MAFELSSPAFKANNDIPKKFSCDGSDVSPALRWSDPPGETRALALVCEDPDAPVGNFVHWVLYDLPASTRELPEGMPNDQLLKNGARQGRNDFRRVGYGGPCPPAGAAHRYFFRLYALNAKTNLKAGATKAELVRVMEGHVVGLAELMGKYKR